MSRCLMPGCTADAKPKGDYCKDAHRAAAHKLRRKMGGVLPTERKRLHDAAAKRVARAQGTIPSDVRLSYRRALAEVTGTLQDIGVAGDEAEKLAAETLQFALPRSKRAAA